MHGRRCEFWGRGGGRPDAGMRVGRTRQKIVAPPPVGSFEKVRRGFKKSEPLNKKVRAPERKSQSRGFESTRVG